MMRLLASTALVIVTCCALCDFAVTLISVTVKTPAQGRVAQRACFRISQSLLTLDRLGPTQVYDAVVFTSQALSAITSGGVTTTIFLSLSYLLSVASRRKHASPEAKKLVRLARALLNLASITWAFISMLMGGALSGALARWRSTKSKKLFNRETNWFNFSSSANNIASRVLFLAFSWTVARNLGRNSENRPDFWRQKVFGPRSRFRAKSLR